jgi:hypothetical protein
MDLALATTNFGRWEQALLTRDPAAVAALYVPHLTLLPTMARRVITDRTGAEEYFTFFGSFQPTVRMVEEHVLPISDASYLHCGVYRFTLTMDGKREDVDARFTMVWVRDHQGWSIFHHHSSRIPTP